MKIRLATDADVERMVTLSDLARSRYAKYSPLFWRKAPGASEKQVPFFRAQLGRENNIVLVAEEQTAVEGFIIASLVDAPPVYAPGGKVCSIDDFAVSTPALWRSAGVALLQEATMQAKARGAVLSVVVCPHLDDAKRTMLQASGATIASEWYVNPL